MSERDPDLLLIERMLAPPPLDDARSSHDYWRRRRRKLPLYRLIARREAKEMTIFWEERVRAAEQAEFERTPVGRVLTALGLSGHWFRRAQLAKKVAVWLVWGLLREDRAVLTFCLACVIAAGLFGGATVSKRIVLVQALPAALALAAVWL